MVRFGWFWQFFDDNGAIWFVLIEFKGFAKQIVFFVYFFVFLTFSNEIDRFCVFLLFFMYFHGFLWFSEFFYVFQCFRRFFQFLGCPEVFGAFRHVSVVFRRCFGGVSVRFGAFRCCFGVRLVADSTFQAKFQRNIEFGQLNVFFNRKL